MTILLTLNFQLNQEIQGDKHMTSTLRGWRKGWGGGRLRQNKMSSDVRDGGLASVLDVQSFFFIKENWVCAMSRHHDEPNINIFNMLLTRYLFLTVTSDSEAIF